MSKSSPDARTLQEIERLVTSLKSAYIGERQEAEQQLQALGASAVEPLMALLTRENQIRIKRRKIYFALVALFCLTFLPAGLYCLYMAMVLSTAGAGQLAGAYGGAVGGLIGGGGGGILGGFSFLLSPRPLEWFAAEALSKTEDKRAVGGLALGLGMPAALLGDVRYVLASALLRLLPRLTAEDANLLDNRQRDCLYAALGRSNRDKETDFCVVIIESLERIEDTNAIPCLEKLTALPATTPNEMRVQEACNTALNTLRRLQELQRTNSTLLRPSQATSPDTLLRATIGPADTTPEVLLRASAPEATQTQRNGQ